MSLKKLQLLAAFVAVASTAGCGGGGGGGRAGSVAIAPPPAPAPAPDIVTSVPTPTYAASSNELLAFNSLNSERARCGFGEVAQNANLDLSASNHRAYLVANQASSHSETPGNSGYTGATPQARAAVAGYSGSSIGEGVTTGIFSSQGTFGDGQRQVMRLMNCPTTA